MPVETSAANGADPTNFGGIPTITIQGSALSAQDASRILSAEVETVLNRPDLCELRVAHNSDGMGTPADDIPATWKPGAALKVESGTGSDKVTLFDGEITSVDYSGGEGQPSEVVLLGFDKRHRLYRGERNKVSIDVKVEDIISSILAMAGLQGTFNGLPTGRLPYHLQHGTGGDQIEELCRTYGLIWFVEESKVVVAAPDSATTEVAPPISPNVTMLRYRFRSTSSSDPGGGTTTVKGWDVRTKDAIIGRAERAAGVATLVHPGPSPSDLGPAPVEHPTFLVDQSEADVVAKAMVRQHLDAGMQLDATCTFLPKLRAGKVVKVESVPARYAGKYRLTQVRHVFDLEEGGRTIIASRGADDPTLPGLLEQAVSHGSPHHDSAATWALRTAIVTNITPEPGKLGAIGNAGEVLVQMPWLGEDVQSSPLRVVMPGGGVDRGLFVMPEVNDEVLVVFEAGDSRRGYVLGGVYNGKDKPPRFDGEWDDGGTVAHRVFRTRTGQELLFSDKSGDEHILLQSSDKKSFIKIDKDQRLISVGGTDIKVDNEGKVDITSQGNITIKSTGGDIAMEAINIKMKATAAFEAEGATAKIKGTGQTDLEGAMVNVKASGVAKVAGNPIMLN